MKTQSLVVALLLLLLAAPRPAVSQEILSGSITTAGADCSVATNCFGFFSDGFVSFGIGLDVGVSGTFVFEVSQNALTNSTGTWTSWPDAVGDRGQATADGSYYFANPGFRRFRVRASAISGAAALSAARGYVPVRTISRLTATDGAELPGDASFGLRVDVERIPDVTVASMPPVSVASVPEAADPCSRATKELTAISTTSDVTIIPASPGMKNYICNIVLHVGTFEIVNVVEGIATNCVSSTVALIGSTTKENGVRLTAEQALSAGSGAGTTIPPTGVNVSTCLWLANGDRVSGWVAWVQAP